MIGDYAYIVSEATQHGLQIVEHKWTIDIERFPFNI